MPYRRNVFILGAGFSAEAGAPTISNFFEQAMELYKNPFSALKEDERAIFGKIFDYRDSLQVAEHKVRINPDNIEDLFGLVEMASHLGQPGAEETQKHLIYVILRTLELTTANVQRRLLNFDFDGNNRTTTTANIYDFFVNAAARRWEAPPAAVSQDAIISLNYDLLLERALAESPADGRLAVAGSKPGSLAPLYDLPSQLVKEPAEFKGISVCRVRLLKLHGSANWAFCQTCERVKVLPLGSASVMPEGPGCECGKAMDARLIVPPAWNKGVYLNLLKPVWQSAAKALEEAQRIWILGYSMPESDKFFQYLLALSLRKNKYLDKVVIVNYLPEHIQRFVTLFKALDEKKRIATKQDTIFQYFDGGSFQRDLHQIFRKAEFAW